MSLTEDVKVFFDAAPVSLVASKGGPRTISEIQDFSKSLNLKNEPYNQLFYAGLLMAEDYIWEAHEIVQDFSQQEASWWHAFMHRMEGDYGNAGYWYRRVGHCEYFTSLQEKVAELSLSTKAADVQSWSSWDSFQFNDLISGSTGEYRQELHEIHRLECLLLLEICYSKAMG